MNFLQSKKTLIQKQAQQRLSTHVETCKEQGIEVTEADKLAYLLKVKQDMIREQQPILENEISELIAEKSKAQSLYNRTYYILMAKQMAWGAGMLGLSMYSMYKYFEKSVPGQSVFDNNYWRVFSVLTLAPQLFTNISVLIASACKNRKSVDKDTEKKVLDIIDELVNVTDITVWTKRVYHVNKDSVFYYNAFVDILDNIHVSSAF